MKALKITGIVILSIIALLIILGLASPKDFKLNRTTIVKTNQAELVYKNISLWSEFIKWNPWMAKDPNIMISYSGIEGEVGSGYHWKGNDKVGEGEMKITALVPNQSVAMDLHFISPMNAQNKTLFTMAPEGDGYKITWEMSGHSKFPMNIMHLFMDKMVGPDFEQGLKNMNEKIMKESATVPPAQ